MQQKRSANFEYKQNEAKKCNQKGLPTLTIKMKPKNATKKATNFLVQKHEARKMQQKIQQKKITDFDYINNEAKYKKQKHKQTKQQKLKHLKSFIDDEKIGC